MYKPFKVFNNKNIINFEILDKAVEYYQSHEQLSIIPIWEYVELTPRQWEQYRRLTAIALNKMDEKTFTLYKAALQESLQEVGLTIADVA
jgi:hypothetical protein